MTLPRPCHQALDSEHSWVGTQKATLESRTPETLGLTYYHCAWTVGAPAEAVGRPGGPDGRRRAIGRLRPSPTAQKGLTLSVVCISYYIVVLYKYKLQFLYGTMPRMRTDIS